jgi:hypothetical protein
MCATLQCSDALIIIIISSNMEKLGGALKDIGQLGWFKCCKANNAVIETWSAGRQL